MTATVLPFPSTRSRAARRRRTPPPPVGATGWAADAHEVLDTVEVLLARGEVAEVLAFCERAVAVLEHNATEIVDPAPLVRLARRLGDLERRARVGDRIAPGRPQR
jgi:hypothetical protein